MNSLFQDAKYGLRMLAKSPGFTLVAVLTLALGIGANTAIFSVINPILFEPLPYLQADRIMNVWSVFEGARSNLAFHTFRELEARNHAFDSVAILEPWQPSMSGPTEPERLDGQSVSHNFFRVLGISPFLGRDFQASDNTRHAPKVAVLSYSLWQRRFHSGRNIVGQTVTLDGDSYTIIGVMPRTFENVVAPSTEIWSPTQYDPSNAAKHDTWEWGNHLQMIGRLRQGVTYQQARADIDTITRTPVPDFPRVPWASLKSGLIVDSLQENVTRSVRPALLAVVGAVMVVLLIACVNVTNLLLSRGAMRGGEFAMRSALGATRPRMIRQLLTESLMLAILGGALGLFLAEVSIRGLVALSPPELPRLGAISLDTNVFVFALAISTLIGVTVGLIPAVHASRTDVQTALKERSRQSTVGHQWTRRALVVSEVALAVMLLASAGLLLRSLVRLFSVETGFDASQVLTMQIQTSGHKFDDPVATRQFFSQALEQVRRVPGVESAGLTSLLPLTDDTQLGQYGVLFEKDHKANDGYNVFRYVVTPGYLETMRIPLRRGRYLAASDNSAAPLSVVISESLAKEVFHGGDPTGQRVHIGPMNRPWYTVVGVVSDVKQTSLAGGLPDDVYITSEQSWFADQAMSLVVRAHGDPTSLVAPLRKAVWSADKDQPIVRIFTMDRLLAASAAERRFVLILFEAFGIAALILSAIGIYGVLAGSVNERTREIGVRVALGASREHIRALITRQGGSLVLLGIGLGLGGALAAGRAIASLLFGISSFDPVTYLGVILLLAGASVLACWVPVRRATRVDPLVALRYE